MIRRFWHRVQPKLEKLCGTRTAIVWVLVVTLATKQHKIAWVVRATPTLWDNVRSLKKATAVVLTPMLHHTLDAAVALIDLWSWSFTAASHAPGLFKIKQIEQVTWLYRCVVCIVVVYTASAMVPIILNDFLL